MAETETTPKVAQISVETNDDNDVSSESQTTPTPSKLNANAVEFVPGQFRSSQTATVTSNAPNPAAPVFTPQYQMGSGGFVPIAPYGVPYYMYVPTNGSGAPITGADGSIVMSPVLGYQSTGASSGFNPSAVPFQPMGSVRPGGLSRHASTTSSRASGRGNSFKGGKGHAGKSQAAEQQKAPAPVPVVMRPEDFPKMLGEVATGPGEAPSSETSNSPKSSWANIAKKTTAQPPAPVIAAVVSEPASPPRKAAPSPKLSTRDEELPPLPVVEKPATPLIVPKAASVRSEPPTEPAARTVPVSNTAKLAPWARVSEESSVVSPKKKTTVAEPETVISQVQEAEVQMEEEEGEIVNDSTPVAHVAETQPIEEKTVSEPPTPVASKSCMYSIDTLRRLRFHDSCRPTDQVRSVIPQLIMKPQRPPTGTSAEEADDWRAEAAATARLMRRGSSRLERRASARMIEISAEMLIPSENSWSVAQQKKDATIDENVKVGRKIFAVLNKLTVEKFNKLADQLFNDCGISKPAHIITLVKYLFEKATIQHHFIGMYADLCTQCLEWLGSDKAPEELVSSIGPGERSSAAADIFRRVLLERCQEAFYSYFLTPEDESAGGANPGASEEEERERTEEEHHKHRLSMLGTVKFVAQLLERRLMTRGVFRNCIETLLYSDERTEDHIECACVFLSEIGQLFDKSNDEPQDAYSKALNEAMETLEDIAEDSETSARIKFAILNLVDLRKNGYVANRLAGLPAGPAKISEIHQQAAKEEKLARTLSRTHTSQSQLATTTNNPDDWETVPTTKRGTSASVAPITPSRIASVIARTESAWKKMDESE